MTVSRLRRASARLSACGLALLAVCSTAQATEEPAHSAELDAAIVASAKRHGVPERLVRRVVMRESRYNPRARNHRYWGLMQISYPTARSMGFRGTPEELLNPVTNLTYAVPYLANAFIAAGKRENEAVRLYAAGYYNTARQHGMLGLLRTADSTPMAGGSELPQVAEAQPQSTSLFGSLTGTAQPQPAQQQQLAYAEPAQPAAATAAQQIQAVAPAQDVAASDKSGGPVAMVADRKGDLQPPKKWLRDGGQTVIARGEQAIESVAAHAASDDGKRKSARRSRKITVFAELESAPASAQAYAATADQQAAAQAAIAQAAPQPTYAPVPAAVAAADPAAQTAPDPATDDARPAKSRARKGHTKVAHAKKAAGTKVAAHEPDQTQAQ